MALPQFSQGPKGYIFKTLSTNITTDNQKCTLKKINISTFSNALVQYTESQSILFTTKKK